MTPYNLRKRKQAPECKLSTLKKNQRTAAVVPKTTPAYFPDDILVDIFKHLNYSKLAKCNLVSSWIDRVICRYRTSLPRFRVHEITLDYIPFLTNVRYNGNLMLRQAGKPILSKEFNEWAAKYGYERKSPIHNHSISQHARNNTSVAMRVLQQPFRDNDYDKLYYERTCNCYKLCYKRCHYFFRNAMPSFLFCANIKPITFNTMNWPLYQHFFRLLTHSGSYFDKISLIHIDFPTWQLFTKDMVPNQRIQCRNLYLFDIADPEQLAWIDAHFRCEKLHFGLKMLDVGEAEIPLDFIFSGTGCTKRLIGKYYRDISIVSKILETFHRLREMPKNMPSVQFKVKECSAIAVRDFELNFSQFLVKEEEKWNGSSSTYEFVNINNSELKLRVSLKFINTDNIFRSPFSADVKLISY